MSSTYNANGSGPHVSSYTLASDGDSGVANINAGIEQLADNVERLTEGWHRLHIVEPFLNADSRWAFSPTRFGWVQTDITDQGQLAFVVAVPPRGTITGFRVARIGHGASSHSGVPTQQPSYKLRAYSVVAGDTAGVPTAIDIAELYEEEFTTDVDSYNVAKVLEIDASNAPGACVFNDHVIGTDDESFYVLEILGESGTNAIGSLLALHGAFIHVKGQ